MEYKISNSYLKVTISDMGAELKSIKKVNEDVEYLWQKNTEIWERQAPLLFPIIGRLKNERYEYNNIKYQILIHGFANTTLFDVFSHTKDSITFLLTDSKETKKVYPFEFELFITFKLNENCIVKEHKIVNKTNGEMYFEIGGHEGFNLALFEDEKMEDYYIEFVKQPSIKTYTSDEDIMMNKEKKEIKLDNNKLYLSPEVFKNDALIIDEFIENEVVIKNNKNNRQVKVSFEDFKYLGIWTKYMRSNYVCIEPWSSLPDANYLDDQLINKQDIVKLEENEVKVLIYTITIL